MDILLAMVKAKVKEQIGKAFDEGLAAGFSLGCSSDQPLLPKDIDRAWQQSDIREEMETLK